MIPKKLYDRDANLWLRDKPLCLSDFTARKYLIKDLSKHKNKKFADLGCGEGYLARKLIKAGGAKVVGIALLPCSCTTALQKSCQTKMHLC